MFFVFVIKNPSWINRSVVVWMYGKNMSLCVFVLDIWMGDASFFYAPKHEHHMILLATSEERSGARVISGVVRQGLDEGLLLLMPRGVSQAVPNAPWWRAIPYATFHIALHVARFDSSAGMHAEAAISSADKRWRHWPEQALWRGGILLDITFPWKAACTCQQLTWLGALLYLQ